MKEYRYVLVVVGELLAPDEGHALMQVQMGHSLTGRLLKFPNEVSIRIVEKEDAEKSQPGENGKTPKVFDEEIQRFRDLTRGR